MNLVRKYTLKFLWHRYKTAYRARRIKLPYPPRELWIEPTNHCNLRCVMCPHGKGLKAPKGYMEIGLYGKIIDDLKKLRVQRINLFLGGESLLHERLVEMVEMARDVRIPVRLHTNATILTEYLSKRLLKTRGLEEVSFSFDGEEKGYYERLRVNAKFDRTLANIRRFLEIKKACGQKAPRVLVQVIKERNPEGGRLKVSEEFKALFVGLPVEKFQPICFHNFGGTLEVAGDVRYKLAKRDYRPCQQPWRSMSVAWNGDVVGCCVDMEKKLVLGDLRKQGVMEVWNGELMKGFRRALAEGRHMEIELCKDCDQVWL